MANKYLKRRFTLRETILLGILLVVLLLGLYFGLVFYPIRSRTRQLSDDLDRVQLQITVAESIKQDYDKMKAELAEIEAAGGTDTHMPQYGHNEQQETLQSCFMTIFTGMTGYNISYGSMSEPDGGVRTRPVTISFTADETNKGDGTVYEKVKSVLHALMSTGFRCAMTNLSLSPEGDLQNGTGVRVTCTINFYELDS